MTILIEEFNAAETEEARLAHDADQLALLVVLKYLQDTGCKPANIWIPPISKRFDTEVGRRLAQAVLETHKDHWWLKDHREKNGETIDTEMINQ